MSTLFCRSQIGPYALSHRLVLAPLTRMRSGQNDIPSDLMVEYYRQRASEGGLLIAEATPVSIRDVDAPRDEPRGNQGYHR